jgi:hypothetical protein
MGLMADPVKGDYSSHEIVAFGKMIKVPQTNRKVRVG